MKSKNFLVNNLTDSMDENSKGTILRSMAIFTAIELCGSIITGKTTRNSKSNFNSFCNSKYIPHKYNDKGILLYEIFRCGVAHSYIPKGAALLSSNPNERKKHLSFYQDGLFIYVPEFSKDVRKAIRLFYKDILTVSQLRTNYNKVINELDTEGKSKYRKFIQTNHIQTKKSKIKRDIITALD